MDEAKFSIQDAIGFGWQTTTANISFFVGVVLLIFLTTTLPTVISKQIKGSVDFSSEQFNGSMAPETLLQAIKTGSQIDPPSAPTPIGSLNLLLENRDLFTRMKEKPAETKEMIKALEKNEEVDLSDLKLLNRLLIQANYSLQTPPRLNTTQRILILILTFIANVFYVITSIGLIKIGLGFVQQEKPDIKELFGNWELFFPVFAISVLQGVAILGGFILLIIPGVYLAIRLQFAAYLKIDQQTNVIESITRSFSLTKGNVIHLFLFGVTIILINIAGALCLLVGLLFTIPISSLASAFVYRKLVPLVK